MTYIKPIDVISPKASWKIIRVLLDRGPENCAYALGEWDGKKRIGFRWNGNDENPIGNPQSRGLPTWTMLDEMSHKQLLSLLSDEERIIARPWLGIDLMFEAVSLVTESRAIALWDFGLTPTVVAKIDCDSIKDLINEPCLADEDCRLIIQQNQDLVTEIAQGLFKLKRYEFKDGQYRIIHIRLEDLKPHKKGFSTTVLHAKRLCSNWVR